MTNVLVLAPHPDDDALGCGGAIRQHVLAGDQVHVVYVTSGELGCPGQDPKLTALMREREAGVCSQVLQTQKATFWRFPDGGLNGSEALYLSIRDLLIDERPEIVYSPHSADAHPDHAEVGNIVGLCLGKYGRTRFYEVWTPLPKVDLCIDITGLVTTKRNAIRAYASQVARNGFDEAMLALNHYRGIMSNPAGPVMYAEAFGVA